MGLPAILGPALGAGGSIISAILGAGAQDDAWQWNYAANMANLRDQKKARQEALDYANDVRDEQHLGATDALGNTTKFVPGQGWVSTLSPEQQQLYDYFFKQELPEKRSQFQRSAVQSRDNADTANALLDQFRRVRKQLPQEAESQLYETATRGIGEGARDVSEAALRQATRTGNSNISGIISKLGAETMKQRGAARTNAALQAEDYVNDKYNSERGGLADLYRMFLGASQNGLEASYDPTGIPQQANSLMSLFSQQATQGNSMGYNARTQPVPLRQPIEANTAWANGAGAIGTALGGLGERASSIGQQNDMNDLLKMYITGGGQLDLGGGGLFGRTADRVTGNRGYF